MELKKQELPKEAEQEIFNLTIKKNLERKSAYIDQVQLVEERPLFSWIDLNPTELCNRRCTFCPRTDPSFYPNQNLHLDLGLARKIADELRGYDYRGAINLCGYGEPLLHPDIVGVVEIIGKGNHLEMVTNGDKLNKQLALDMFNAGLDVLVVSLYDGPYQVEMYEDMFAEIGIKPGQYILRDRWYGIEEDYGVKLTNRAGTVQSGNQPVVVNDRPCFYTHYSLQIDWNGDVMLCAQDFNKKVKFGNLYAKTMIQIWHSREVRKFREMLGKGFRGITPCCNCNVNGTLHGEKHWKEWVELYGGEQ